MTAVDAENPLGLRREFTQASCRRRGYQLVVPPLQHHKAPGEVRQVERWLRRPQQEFGQVAQHRRKPARPHFRVRLDKHTDRRALVGKHGLADRDAVLRSKVLCGHHREALNAAEPLAADV
jgi:hypothetical protein